MSDHFSHLITMADEALFDINAILEYFPAETKLHRASAALGLLKSEIISSIKSANCQNNHATEWSCFMRLNGRTHGNITLKHLPRQGDILKIADFEEYTVVSVKFLLNNLNNVTENRIEVDLRK